MQVGLYIPTLIYMYSVILMATNNAMSINQCWTVVKFTFSFNIKLCNKCRRASIFSDIS